MDVPPESISRYGAVSKEVALAMACGALNKSSATFSIAVTGFAGPDSDEGMTGTVFIAVASKVKNNHIVRKYKFPGSREDIRRETVENSMLLLTEFFTMESSNA